jgi:hypothetical protein
MMRHNTITNTILKIAYSSSYWALLPLPITTVTVPGIIFFQTNVITKVIYSVTAEHMLQPGTWSLLSYQVLQSLTLKKLRQFSITQNQF